MTGHTSTCRCRRGMKSSEAPALLINAGNGTQMVNYRVAGNYYVVDRLFSDAVMVAGRGTRTGPRDDLVCRGALAKPKAQRAKESATAYQ